MPYFYHKIDEYVIIFYNVKIYHLSRIPYYYLFCFLEAPITFLGTVYIYQCILDAQYIVHSAKILLLPTKYEIIMVPSYHSFFQYCEGNIGLFFIASSKVIILNPLCILLVSVLCFFFDSSLSKFIALPTIAISI